MASSTSKVVLFTGVADPAVASCVRHLAALGPEHGISKVVGVDATLPTEDLGDVKFLRADIRTPVISKVLAVEDVDTVVHLGLRPHSGRLGGKEMNVIGSMQVLAACQRNDNVHSFVLGSSTAVYGTSAKDPAMWTETGAARGGVSSGFPKDVVEVESYTRGLGRRRPDISITTLRFAQVMWPESNAPMAIYLRKPVLPTVAGYDPRLQVLHLTDACAMVQRAIFDPHPGIYNVAAPGVMLLSQMARILAAPTLPMLPVGAAGSIRRVARLMGEDVSPDLPRLLTHGRGVDVSKMIETFGYEPSMSTRDTIEEFAATRQPGLLQRMGVVR